MTVLKDGIYLLYSVVSTYNNPIHQQIAGHTCTLDRFCENEFGWFAVELEDGPHTICTTIVRKIEQPDENAVVVYTSNSVYTFIHHDGLTMEMFEPKEEAAHA